MTQYRIREENFGLGYESLFHVEEKFWFCWFKIDTVSSLKEGISVLNKHKQTRNMEPYNKVVYEDSDSL